MTERIKAFDSGNFYIHSQVPRFPIEYHDTPKLEKSESVRPYHGLYRTCSEVEIYNA